MPLVSRNGQKSTPKLIMKVRYISFDLWQHLLANTSEWHSLPIFKMCTYPWSIWHIIRRHIYYKQFTVSNWTVFLQFNTLHVNSGYSFTQTRRLICRNSHGHPQEKIWPTWSQPTPRQRETGKPGARLNNIKWMSTKIDLDPPKRVPNAYLLHAYVAHVDFYIIFSGFAHCRVCANLP